MITLDEFKGVVCSHNGGFTAIYFAIFKFSNSHTESIYMVFSPVCISSLMELWCHYCIELVSPSVWLLL